MTDTETKIIEKLQTTTRLEQIPILHVRGNHYVVGYTIGRTFKNSIHDVLSKCNGILDSALLAYSTTEGNQIYENCLKLCRKKFPGYVKELEGMSHGCDIPFYKLFLLHIDTLIIPPPVPDHKTTEVSESTKKIEYKEDGSRGCSSIISFYKHNIFLGHTEDGGTEQLNNTFILSAEILDEELEKIEKFSTLCYAGFLPGGTMGYNNHGIIHSVNAMGPGKIFSNKTPILFIMRALLKASTVNEVTDILTDTGTGCSDGLSVNIIYSPSGKVPIVQNIEIGPNSKQNLLESEISIFNVPIGESYIHCNKILRLTFKELNEEKILSSIKRHKTIEKYKTPYDLNSIKNILSEQSNNEFPIFRDDMSKPYITLVAGIFDIENRIWSIYTNKPTKSDPVVKLTMEF